MFSDIKKKGFRNDYVKLFFFLVYSIPSAYVHMIWGNQNNSYNLC